MSKLVNLFLILISLVCLVLAAAPFTPAIGVSFLMLLVAGVMGFRGLIQQALILLLINTLAVVASPSIDISYTDRLVLVLIVFPIAFGGVMLGVRRLNLKITALSD